MTGGQGALIRAGEKEAEGIIAKAAADVLRDAEGPAARRTAGDLAGAGERTAESELDRAIAGTATRANELQAALPAGARGRVTMATGIGRDAEGNVVHVVGTSEPRGYLRNGVDLLPGEQLARGAGHAETSILDHMAQNGITPIAVGAGRAVCEGCEAALNGVGARITTALKRLTTAMGR